MSPQGNPVALLKAEEKSCFLTWITENIHMRSSFFFFLLHRADESDPVNAAVFFLFFFVLMVSSWWLRLVLVVLYFLPLPFVLFFPESVECDLLSTILR